MATTLTNWTESTIILPSLAALKNGLVPLKALSFAVDVGGRMKDDVVRVPITAARTATAKTAGSTLASGGSSATTAVTLDTYYAATWQVNEAEVSGARAQDVFRSQAVEGAYAVAAAVLNSAFALATAANYGSGDEDLLEVAPADFGQNDLGALWSKAETKKLGRDRSLVLNGSFAGALFGDSNLALILATLGKAGAILNAELPPMNGMTPYVYSALPTNSESLGGLVCDKGAIAVAMAAFEGVAAAGEGDLMSREIITDPESSVVLVYKRWYKSDEGAMFGRFEALWGVAKVQDSLIRIKG
jgi:hypothetical protein